METSTFQKRCMLVRLKTHRLSTTVTDKTLSSQVRSDKGVKSTKGGSWKKRLFTEGYEPIQKLFTKIGKHHKRYTVPFDDDGYAMLRASLYQEYKEGIDILIDELNAEVEKFVAGLDAIIAKDRETLGETFDPADYPSVEEVREKISVEYTFQALPNLDGVEVNSFTISELEKINEERLQKVMHDAAAKPLNDLLDLLAKATTTLGDPDKKFKNSLIGNIKEYVADVQHLNVTDDGDITEAALKIEALLKDVEDVDQLRCNAEYRSKAHHKIMEVADSIKKVGSRKLKV